MNLKQIKSKYDRFSIIYNLIEWPIEKLFFNKWRKKLLSNVKGTVLEIGVGTGKNLPYYNYSQIKLTAVDISQGMIKKAEYLSKKNKYTLTLRLVESDKLPFKSNSFDIIVNTFLLCSVSSQEKMLKEIKRIIKPGGKILMLEHMLSKNRFIALVEKIHNPITRFLFGFNINRKTKENIIKSGLKITKEKDLAIKDVFKELEVRK